MAGWGAGQGVKGQRSVVGSPGFDKYRSGGVTGGDIKTHTITLRYRTLVQSSTLKRRGRISIRIIMFIFIIMITTIPKHSKKDIQMLKSILQNSEIITMLYIRTPNEPCAFCVQPPSLAPTLPYVYHHPYSISHLLISHYSTHTYI